MPGVTISADNKEENPLLHGGLDFCSAKTKEENPLLT